MKKITGSLLLYLIISQTQTIAGQTNGNTIVLPNSSWSILRYGVTYPVPWVSTQYVYFAGDSVVTDKTYKKVFSCDDKLHENITYEGLIREQDKKTWFICKDSETENLLYDFSLEEGMTFEYSSMYPEELPELLYVKNSDIIEINGETRKRLQLSFPPLPGDDWIVDTWIEGIGSLRGILQPLLLDGVVSELLCHHKNDELIYKNPVYSECYYDKAEDITSMESKITNDLTVYPNPVDNILVISSSNDAVSFVEFTGVSGKTVYTKRLDANKENKIDMRRFAPGLYLLHVYDTNGLVSTAKIIKR
jgi:hypothetical protein